MSAEQGTFTPAAAPVTSGGYLIRLANPYPWLVLLLSLPVIGPLLQPGYFWGAHDARHSVYFLFQFDKAIGDGVLYPRWAPDFAFGYGYPFFNIYGPLSSYAGELFHLAGLDIVTSVKVVFGLSALLSGLAMYLFVARLLGRPAGLVAALVYVYLPYHLFDLYVRAALAESVGFVFLPLALWGFYEAVTRPHLPALLWAALAYAGLMFTSNLLALLFTPILGGYVAYILVWQFVANGRNRRVKNAATPAENHGIAAKAGGNGSFAGRPSPVKTFILSLFPPAFVLGLGLGLSGIFVLPVLTEASFVRTDQWFGGRYAFGDDFVEIFQLFSSRWGFGASIPGPDDETGFQLGLAATVLFVLSFWTVPRLRQQWIRRSLYFFQGATLVLIFLTIPLSAPIWELLSLAQFAQFPWRLLVIIAPFISIVAGSIAASLSPGDTSPRLDTAGSSPGETTSQASRPPATFRPPLALIILCCLVLLASYPYLRAEVRDPKPTEGPVSQAALFRFQQAADEMTGQTAWVRRIPNWSSLAEQIERGGAITTKVNYSALPADDSLGVYSMEMDSVHELLWVGTDKEDQAVTFLIPYYPGWQVYIYQDLGPHDGNLDKTVGPVTRIGPVVSRPAIQTTALEGWMVVPVPPGSHFLELRFEDTAVRIAGRWLSLFSLILLLVLFLLPLIRRHWFR